ncbi:hypothetical protein FACS189472_13030 [Alphaproteobacteria bacterium]|nr:hypothetical protein FACS189472_13030 [Alphaproteobacteria bacterium]
MEEIGDKIDDIFKRFEVVWYDNDGNRVEKLTKSRPMQNLGIDETRARLLTGFNK